MQQLEALARALADTGITYKENEPLGAHTTFKIGGNAKLFAQPRDAEEICKAILLCNQNSVRYFLLGNGSNLLFADTGFDGAVIDISASASAPVFEAEEAGCAQPVLVHIGAGTLLSSVCLAALERGLSGLEFAYGIPGTVGGAVYMNAGAYGGEMKDVLVSASALTADGQRVTLPAAALDLTYRHSIFEENGACILGAVLRLKKDDPAAIRARMDDFMQRRRDKQPLDKPSAGSTFKRPAGAFAAALIDQCGLRGYRVGDAAVSEKHCGFVVNLGHATAAEVLALCGDVSRIVKEKTGYTLEKEIRVIG